MNFQTDSSNFKNCISNGANGLNAWQNSAVNRSQFVTEDNRKLMRSSNEMNCHSSIPPVVEMDEIKLSGSNCIEPRPVVTGGDLSRFDNYQPVNFVSYINTISGDERDLTREKFQNLGGYDRRDCNGDDKDQQLSVISEYIEEEEGFIDDDDDGDDEDDGEDDHTGQKKGENSRYCQRKRALMGKASLKREKRSNFHQDIETESSSGNSSKADSESSKLLIIS